MELKSYLVYTPMDDTAEGLWELDSINLEGKEVYLANEADAIIKELKAQKAQAEDDCAYWKNKYNDCKRELDLLKDTQRFYNGGR